MNEETLGRACPGRTGGEIGTAKGLADNQAFSAAGDGQGMEKAGDPYARNHFPRKEDERGHRQLPCVGPAPVPAPGRADFKGDAGYASRGTAKALEVQ